MFTLSFGLLLFSTHFGAIKNNLLFTPTGVNCSLLRPRAFTITRVILNYEQNDVPGKFTTIPPIFPKAPSTENEAARKDDTFPKQESLGKLPERKELEKASFSSSSSMSMQQRREKLRTLIVPPSPEKPEKEKRSYEGEQEGKTEIDPKILRKVVSGHENLQTMNLNLQGRVDDLEKTVKKMALMGWVESVTTDLRNEIVDCHKTIEKAVSKLTEKGNEADAKWNKYENLINHYLPQQVDLLGDRCHLIEEQMRVMATQMVTLSAWQEDLTRILGFSDASTTATDTKGPDPVSSPAPLSKMTVEEAIILLRSKPPTGPPSWAAGLDERIQAWKI